MRVGELLKYFKRGWNGKEERGNKDFKKGGGGDWVKGWMPKKGELEPPYSLCIYVIYILYISVYILYILYICYIYYTYYI